jgi:DNA-directed RNA polymerase subunit K/omega
MDGDLDVGGEEFIPEEEDDIEVADEDAGGSETDNEPDEDPDADMEDNDDDDKLLAQAGYNITDTNLQTKEVVDGPVMTSDTLSRYELALLIGIRALAIQQGAVSKIDVMGLGLHEPDHIAYRELLNGVYPLRLFRPIAVVGTVQYVESIDPNKLALPLHIGAPDN